MSEAGSTNSWCFRLRELALLGHLTYLTYSYAICFYLIHQPWKCGRGEGEAEGATRVTGLCFRLKCLPWQTMTNQCVQGCFVVPPELSLALAKPPLLQETWDELFQSADKDAASYHSSHFLTRSGARQLNSVCRCMPNLQGSRGCAWLCFWILWFWKDRSKMLDIKELKTAALLEKLHTWIANFITK